MLRTFSERLDALVPSPSTPLQSTPVSCAPTQTTPTPTPDLALETSPQDSMLFTIHDPKSSTHINITLDQLDPQPTSDPYISYHIIPSKLPQDDLAVQSQSPSHSHHFEHYSSNHDSKVDEEIEISETTKKTISSSQLQHIPLFVSNPNDPIKVPLIKFPPPIPSCSPTLAHQDGDTINDASSLSQSLLFIPSILTQTLNLPMLLLEPNALFLLIIPFLMMPKKGRRTRV